MLEARDWVPVSFYRKIDENGLILLFFLTDIYLYDEQNGRFASIWYILYFVS